MGAVSSLKRVLDRPSTFDASIDNPFLHLDASGMLRQLKVEERGEENGNQELPRTEAHSLDSVEHEIASRVRQVWQEAASDADRWFIAIDQRISNLSLLTQLPTIESSAIQTVSNIRAEVAQATLRLTTARDAVTQSYVQLRDFQKRHSLNRPARLSPSGALVLGTIALTWVFETLANSVLLRQNDDMGLLGGIAAAAVIGLINIGVAVFVGRSVLPQLNMTSAARPVFLGLSVLWAGFLVAWNLFAAHYRDAKVAGVSGPEFAAVNMMRDLPASIYSWGLFILGLVFALVAAGAAYRSRDPFPGYAEVWEEHERRCADYAGEVEDASEELKDFHDDASETFASIRNGLSQQQSDQARALSGHNAFAQKLLRFREEVEQAGNLLLSTYRDRNIIARSSPPPAYFADPFTLPSANIPAAPKVAVTSADVERGDRILADAQRSVSDAYLEAVYSFETLETLKARLPS